MLALISLPVIRRHAGRATQPSRLRVGYEVVRGEGLGSRLFWRGDDRVHGQAVGIFQLAQHRAVEARPVHRQRLHVVAVRFLFLPDQGDRIGRFIAARRQHIEFGDQSAIRVQRDVDHVAVVPGDDLAKHLAEAVHAQASAKVAQRTWIGEGRFHADLEKHSIGHIRRGPADDLSIREVVVITQVFQLVPRSLCWSRISRPSRTNASKSGSFRDMPKVARQSLTRGLPPSIAFIPETSCSRASTRVSSVADMMVPFAFLASLVHTSDRVVPDAVVAPRFSHCSCRGDDRLGDR